MLATSTEIVTYAGLWDRGRELLAPLGITESAGPATPKSSETISCCLTTAIWNIGLGDTPIAELHAAKIVGPSDDALIVRIRSTDPARIPAFAAELVATDGFPTVAYIDLPSSGMSRNLLNDVTDQTTVLSIRHAPFLPRDETPPAWVLNHSPGGFLFTQTSDRDALARLSQAFEDYLNVWIDFAYPFADQTDLGRPGLNRNNGPSFLHDATQSLLTQHFGLEWTNRFIEEFVMP